MEVSGSPKGLPENAYRKLKPGEEYVPVVPADKLVPELTGYSLAWGLFYAALFTAAAAYLGLKIGQVFEAAIPITILAMGMSSLQKRKNALQENVIIQSIGSASGVVVAGAIFTIPGIYILGLADRVGFGRIFLASLLGGFLGILFLIPFRRFFVKDMHGEFPFPEATASTEVLMAGESDEGQAGILLQAGIIAGVYNFAAAILGFWREKISTIDFAAGNKFAMSSRLEFKLLTDAAVIGLGYIVGLRYALIIASGSFLAWWVMVPMVGYIGVRFEVAELISMGTGDLFKEFVRPVGIGAIAMAGMIGIWKSRDIIVGAFKLAANEISGGHGEDTGPVERTQSDLSMKNISIFIGLTLVAVFFFFWLYVTYNVVWALVGLGIVAIISFLFTTVAARAIAIVGSNPVSGMTLMTLIISSVILNAVGLSGESGIVAALLIGGVVCTALSMSGGFVSDLKIGYWLGTTPKVQQQWKFLGTIVSAASVAGVIMMLDSIYHFGAADSPLEAPQATVMAELIKPLMMGGSAPWLLYMGGAILALVLEWVGVPPLAFALGMYLPLHLNTPVLAGGVVAHFVGMGGSEEVKTKRKAKGTLMASGFVAGGAIMGVVGAFVLFVGKGLSGQEDWLVTNIIGTTHWAEDNPWSSLLALVLFVGVCLYLYKSARSAAKD
jgi:putative OPT family oligopeptide transporter